MTTPLLTKTKHKVLVIDDSLMARKLIVSYLNSDEFEIYEGKNGREGLAVASEVHPDLILLDFVMPGMNGFEVYQALRAQDQFARTPVIVFSSSYDEVVKKFGYPFEGFEFLHKHATNDQVLACIESLLSEATELVDELITFDVPAERIHDNLILQALESEYIGSDASSVVDSDYNPSSNDIADALASLSEPTLIALEQTHVPTNPLPLEPQSSVADTEVSSQLLKSITDQGSTLRTLNKTVDSLLFQVQQLESRVDKYASRERATPSFWTWMMVTAIIAAVVGMVTGSLLSRSVVPRPTDTGYPTESNPAPPPVAP